VVTGSCVGSAAQHAFAPNGSTELAEVPLHAPRPEVLGWRVAVRGLAHPACDRRLLMRCRWAQQREETNN